MPKYIVGIREVWVSHREVESQNPEEAKRLANDEYEMFNEYSHTLDPELWTVEEARDEA